MGWESHINNNPLPSVSESSTDTDALQMSDELTHGGLISKMEPVKLNGKIASMIKMGNAFKNRHHTPGVKLGYTSALVVVSHCVSLRHQPQQNV